MKRFLLALGVGLLVTAPVQAQITEEDLRNDQTVTNQILSSGL